jgi:hypothetical protein
MVDDGDGRLHGPHAGQYAAGADQHAGEFSSPRGCRGTFGSVGTANATRVEANFTGTDCQLATFSGTIVLTKD